jgi:hypothetical protein
VTKPYFTYVLLYVFFTSESITIQRIQELNDATDIVKGSDIWAGSRYVARAHTTANSLILVHVAIGYDVLNRRVI